MKGIWKMEKELIKAEQYSTKPFLIISLTIAGILFSYTLQPVNFYNEGMIWFCFWVSLFLLIDGIFVHFFFGKCSLVVTNQRVYGKTAFGRQVDLPLDSISAIGITNFIMIHSIEVSTSSGKIHFYLVKNDKAVYGTLSRLLQERQMSSSLCTSETVIKQESNVDELRKYKQLLDEGIITQEEFDAKKKQLLDL